jgi:hypothetical protein
MSEVFIVSRKDNLRVACISKYDEDSKKYFGPGYDLGAKLEKLKCVHDLMQITTKILNTILLHRQVAVA